MGESGANIGLQEIGVFTALIVAMQGFIGLPVASFCLRKNALLLKKQFAAGGAVSASTVTKTTGKKRLIPNFPEAIRGSANFLLAKLGVAVVLAIWLSSLTGGVIHRFVMCLIVGVLLKALGFLDDNIMTRANSFGFAMVALMAVVFGNLATASGEILASLAGPIAIAFVLGLTGIVPPSLVVGKLLGVAPYMSLAIGITTMVGFPGTFIVSNEVAKSYAQTEEERKFILDSILPKMLVAGFATVTVGSVIMAGVMANFLK
jgi:hypothetical protein